MSLTAILSMSYDSRRSQAAFPGAHLGALVVGDCLVRRFLCAALVFPRAHGLDLALDAQATHAHAAFADAHVRPAVLVAKVLQLACCHASASSSASSSSSSMSACLAKDAFMLPLAAFIERERDDFRAFVATLRQSLGAAHFLAASGFDASALAVSRTRFAPPLCDNPLYDTSLELGLDESREEADTGARSVSVLHAPAGANPRRHRPVRRTLVRLQQNQLFDSELGDSAHSLDVVVDERNDLDLEFEAVSELPSVLHRQQLQQQLTSLCAAMTLNPLFEDAPDTPNFSVAR